MEFLRYFIVWICNAIEVLLSALQDVPVIVFCCTSLICSPNIMVCFNESCDMWQMYQTSILQTDSKLSYQNNRIVSIELPLVILIYLPKFLQVTLLCLYISMCAYLNFLGKCLVSINSSCWLSGCYLFRS